MENIITERLVVRRFEPKDGPDLYEYWSDTYEYAILATEWGKPTDGV